MLIFLNILEPTFIYITLTNILSVLLRTPKFILSIFYVIFLRTDFYAATYWKIKQVHLWPTNSLCFVGYIFRLQFVRSRFSSYTILNEFFLKFIQAKWPNHCKILQWIMTGYTESSVSRRTWRSWRPHSLSISLQTCEILAVTNFCILSTIFWFQVK